MSRETIIEPLFSSPLAAALIDAGLIDRDTLDRVSGASRPAGAGLLTTLLDGELVDEAALALFLAERYCVGSVCLAELAPNPHLLDLIGERLARRHDVVPVAREGGVLTVATADPTNVVALDDVAFVTGLDVRAVVAPRRDR
jgi:type IV pilus assembly protein PilB